MSLVSGREDGVGIMRWVGERERLMRVVSGEVDYSEWIIQDKEVAPDAEIGANKRLMRHDRASLSRSHFRSSSSFL